MQKDKKKNSKQNNSKTKKNTFKGKTVSKNESKSKTKNTTFKKVLKKFLIVLVCLFILAELIYGAYMIYENYAPKFKDLEIEIGSVTSLSVADFAKKDKYIENSVLLTNLDDIDYTSIGTYNITLSYNGSDEEVTLSLVDTTAPLVTFTDVEAYIDYELDVDDFIVSVEDLQDTYVELVNEVNIDGYGEYVVTISVIDESNNITTHTSRLLITWIKEKYKIEYGDVVTKKDLLYNIDEDIDLIDDEVLKEINSSEIGEYSLLTEKDGIEFTTTINIVKDLTSPVVELQSITIYNDEIDSINTQSFIKSIQDDSEIYSTSIVSDIDYTLVGEQEVIIRVTDIYENYTDASTTLTILKDTDNPVFTGLSDLKVSKGTEINYTLGVSATDERDGECEYSVDSSSVDVSTAGVYYATYTAEDSSGNKTVKKRKVEVLPTSDDTQALVQEVADSLADNVVTLTNYCRNNISYSHNSGGDDPVWYGLTYHTGDCLVHAMCLQALLEAKGYESLLIWTTDETHYWVLVYIEGTGWRHLEPTPLADILQERVLDLMTDAQRKRSLNRRTWDTSLWPAAE